MTKAEKRDIVLQVRTKTFKGMTQEELRGHCR